MLMKIFYTIRLDLEHKMKQLQEQIKENGKHWFTLTGHFQHTRCIL